MSGGINASACGQTGIAIKKIETAGRKISSRAKSNSLKGHSIQCSASGNGEFHQCNAIGALRKNILRRIVSSQS